MHVLDESDLLLDLLREAGDEPVTLDELQIVGVREPARALLALELAGHSVHRVYETPRPGRSVTCIRLGAARPAPAACAALVQTAPAPAPVPAADGPDRRIVLGALLGFVVLLLLARRD